MSDAIEMQWLGFRKDSNRGSIYGWFVLRRGHDPYPSYVTYHSMLNGESLPPNLGYVVRGRIGKQLYIEEQIITHDFLEEMERSSRNFTRADPAKLMKKWSKGFDDELSMFLTMATLRDR